MRGGGWRRAGALAAAPLLVLLAAPAAAMPAADFWTTLRVTLDLVLADTRDGVVTLHGFASNDTERAQAESIARGVGATRPVRNLIQVVPEASQRDDEIRVGLAGLLRADPELAAARTGPE